MQHYQIDCRAEGEQSDRGTHYALQNLNTGLIVLATKPIQHSIREGIRAVLIVE